MQSVEQGRVISIIRGFMRSSTPRLRIGNTGVTDNTIATAFLRQRCIAKPRASLTQSGVGASILQGSLPSMRIDSHFSLNAPSTKSKSVMLQQALGDLYQGLHRCLEAVFSFTCANKRVESQVNRGAHSEFSPPISDSSFSSSLSVLGFF